MLVNKAQKIFVEPDEEIVFTIEKILEAKSDKLILIIPNAAILTSSAVSLKILASQVAKTGKLVVLVSDDHVAKQLAHKAKLILADKISDVDKDIWMQAKQFKDDLLIEKNRIRSELLQVRQEGPSDEVPAVVLPEKVKAVLESDEDEQSKKKNEPLVKERPRLKGKVIDINGLKIFAGGDIIENEELLKMERDRKDTLNTVVINDITDNIVNEKNMEDHNSFVGIDMTKQLSTNEVYKPLRKSTSPKFFESTKSFFARISKVVSMKKLILSILAVVVVYVLISFFFFTSVSISVKLEQNTLSVKKSITAKPDAAESFDVATLTIKSDPVTKTNSTSSEVESTGVGKTGEFAQGQLLVVNPGVTAIEVKIGQVFSYNYLTTPLKYTAIAAAIIDPSSSKTITVKAEAFGEAYNIDDTVKNFIPEGMSNTISAQNVTKMTGGTTKEVKAISQEDLDSVKQTLLDKLKNDLASNLKSLLSENEIILTGSEAFKEDSFVTSSKLGDVVDKFTAELKVTITAIKINKTVVKNLIQESLKVEAGYSTVTINDPVIENVVMSGQNASFDAKANANAMNELDLDALKQEIKGKSVSEVKDLIKSKPGVAEVIIRYSPSFIPLNMQSIPTDDAKITLIKIDN